MAEGYNKMPPLELLNVANRESRFVWATLHGAELTQDLVRRAETSLTSAAESAQAEVLRRLEEHAAWAADDAFPPPAGPALSLDIEELRLVRTALMVLETIDTQLFNKKKFGKAVRRLLEDEQTYTIDDLVTLYTRACDALIRADAASVRDRAPTTVPARFTHYKLGGKYYGTGNGQIPIAIAKGVAGRNRADIVAANGGTAPGLASDGRYFVTIVEPLTDIGDDYFTPFLLPAAPEPEGS